MSDWERKKLFYELLQERERLILKDLYYHEPDCAKFISRRLRMDLKETMEGLKLLVNLGIIERVQATFVRKGRVLKHRNHTYYELKGEWRSFFKKFILERS